MNKWDICVKRICTAYRVKRIVGGNKEFVQVNRRSLIAATYTLPKQLNPSYFKHKRILCTFVNSLQIIIKKEESRGGREEYFPV